LIWVEFAGVAVSVAGVLGATVSPPCACAVTIVEYALRLPAASVART
jgi:hypothetical protein